MSQSTLTIDGSQVHGFDSFIREFNRAYSRFDVLWDGNLDAFNDYLVWPVEPYVLVWTDSHLSREQLGYGEMIKWLEATMQACHPTNLPHLRVRLEAAKQGQGQTMFDKLIEIIQGKSDYVQLRLE